MPSTVPEILPIAAIDRRAPTPLYRQIYQSYRDAVASRRLRPGQRLPSTRALAAELGISRIPVLAAFEQLLAEGYFETRTGAGTFVAAALPVADPRAGTSGSERPARGAPRRLATGTRRYGRRNEPWMRGAGAFRTSIVDTGTFPFGAWARLLARLARNPRSSLLRYGDPMGYLPFRERLAAYLRTARGVRCEAEQILVVSGSQHALQVAALALLDPGDLVWVEEPGYPGARDALALGGAKLVPMAVDEEGLDVARAIARTPRARLAHVTPSHQYPLGATMSAARRMQLLDWARSAGAWILEDDYDSEFRYDSQPIASLQGLDTDARVLYVGTFSKVLFPSLRLGYMVVPADLVERFSAVREALDIFPPTLPQAALAEFFDQGHFARHIRRVRTVYGERRAALVEALRQELGDDVEIAGDQAGMQLVALLRKGVDDHAIALAAAQRGLWTMPLSSCYAARARRSGLILGYGGTTIGEIRAGARRLRELIPRSAVV